MVEEAKHYHLNILEVSSTKRRDYETVDVDGTWKLFYCGADLSMFAQTSVGILTSPRLLDCVSDWIPLGSRVCIVEAQSIKSVISPIACICP